MPIPSSLIVSSAGAAAGQKVNQEVLGKCLIDKQGNVYTVGSKFFRLLTIFFNVILVICIAGLMVLTIVFPEDNDFLKDPTTLIVLILGVICIILLNLIYKYGLKCKYTLLADGLKIEKANLNATIPYSQVHCWMTKYPPVEYRFFYCIILNDRMIRYNFSFMVGSLGFLALLCQMAQVPVPDINRMEDKVTKGFSRGTKEEKLAYQQMKQIAKQLKTR